MVQLHFKATFKGDPLDPKKWDHKIIQLAKSCLEQKLSASPQIFPDELAQNNRLHQREWQGPYSIKGPSEIAEKIRAAMLEP